MDYIERAGGGVRRALAAMLAVAATVLVAAGCGGSTGAGAQGGSGNSSGSSATSDILLYSDKSALDGASATSAGLTIVAKDASGNVLANQIVALSVNEPKAILTGGTTPLKTDAGGKASATLALSSEAVANTYNRTIRVSVAIGTVTRSIDLPFTNMKLSVSGPTTLESGSSGTYTATVVDSTGRQLNGVRLTATAEPANASIATPSRTTGVEDPTNPGKATFTVTAGTTSTTLVFTVDGNPSAVPIPLVARVPLQVSSNILQIAASPSGAVPINTDRQVVLTHVVAGQPQVGKYYLLTTSRGVLAATSGGTGVGSLIVQTGVAGSASFYIRSPNVGSGVVTAFQCADATCGSIDSNSLTSNGALSFISTTPSKIVLNPDPVAISVSGVPGQSATSKLTAVVRDAQDNPAQGVLVLFSVGDKDPSGGASISPAAALTNSAGVATAVFSGGPNATGANGVQVIATLASGSGASATNTITVSQVPLYVELGTGAVLQSTNNDTTYSMPWTAIVSDSNGNPVAGATVTTSLAAVSYYKGIWGWNGTVWVPLSANNVSNPPVECANEDLNNNNLLDAGEDRNATERLEPGRPAVSTVPATGATTDSTGTVTFNLVYPKSFGNWVKVRLRVSIATGGTQSSSYRTFVLPVLSTDVSSQTTAPPSVNALTPNSWTYPKQLVGPFGYRQDNVALTVSELASYQSAYDLGFRLDIANAAMCTERD